MNWKSIFDEDPPQNEFCAFIDSGGDGGYGHFVKHPSQDNVILFIPYRSKNTTLYIRRLDHNYCRHHFWMKIPSIPKLNNI